MIRSVRSAQTSDYPLHAVPMDQISMELFNIADTANCNWGVLITMYPDAIGWGACIWILSLLTERFAGVLTLSLRRNFESGIHTCSILRAFASLITIWNFPLQAVFRLFYRIIFGLLRWIHLPPGNPPTTVSVIVYADPAAGLTVTHPTTPRVIIRSSSGNYHMFGSGMNAFNTPSNLGPQAHRPRNGTYFQSIPLLSSEQPIQITVGRQQDILLGHCNSKLPEQFLYRHQWIDRTGVATDEHYVSRFRRLSSTPLASFPPVGRRGFCTYP